MFKPYLFYIFSLLPIIPCAHCKKANFPNFGTIHCHGGAWAKKPPLTCYGMKVKTYNFNVTKLSSFSSFYSSSSSSSLASKSFSSSSLSTSPFSSYYGKGAKYYSSTYNFYCYLVQKDKRASHALHGQCIFLTAQVSMATHMLHLSLGIFMHDTLLQGTCH